MNEDFIFRLGADVSSFTKSITEVEAELKKARATVKTALGDDLVIANKNVEDLEQSLKNLKNTNVNIPEINVGKSAQKAQNTLTGLSGVVRDLPFGFIAIQNNLPILIDQFSALTKESGGVGGAIEELGGELLGPAGAAFAFGAVTSIVTTLIQKYGSLGAALKAFTIENQALIDAQTEFQEETAKVVGGLIIEETKVKALSNALLDSKTPRKDQIAYYEELKKIAPDVVAGLDAENLGTETSNKLISQNIALRAESVKLQIQEAGIRAVAQKNAEELAIATKKEADAKIKLAQAEKDFKEYAKIPIAAGSQQVSTYADAIKYAKFEVTEAGEAIQELTQIQDAFLGQLDPITLRVAEINNKFKEQNDQLKLNNKETETSESNSKKRAAALEREAKAIEKRNAAERAARTERVPFLVSFEIAAIAKQDYGALYKKNVIDKFKEAQKRLGNAVFTTKLPEVDTSAILKSLIDVQNATAERRAQILKEANLQAATDLFKSTFFNPVQDLFSDLISGADGAFKAFSNAVLKAINQIVAKIIATGIISLLANLISGGTAGLGKAVLGDVLGAFGFAIGKVANPNFGGINAGALNMAGAVNVVLRGQDLVGSLNRTNAQINRVG